jgi:hypothetical protein
MSPVYSGYSGTAPTILAPPPQRAAPLFVNTVEMAFGHPSLAVPIVNKHHTRPRNKGVGHPEGHPGVYNIDHHAWRRALWSRLHPCSPAQQARVLSGSGWQGEWPGALRVLLCAAGVLCACLCLCACLRVVCAYMKAQCVEVTHALRVMLL